MAWWGVKWTRDGTAHQQNMGDLEVEKTILTRVCWRFHREGWYIKTENNSVCFSVPSSSMTSILSPSTSWPTNRKPFSSKWLLSSGLTCSQNQGIHLDHRLSRWPYAKRLNAALWVQPWIGPLLIRLSPTNSLSNFLFLHWTLNDDEILVQHYLKSMSVPFIHILCISIELSWNTEEL